ncbi:hypothetical protein TBLA_0G03160 [Henningerozyma blattae CBS 6284]|uniref:Deacetylase sirtuin-type domain-containing protein n=1 Tax=Henningerozyma blattae (strain ATCC 34711 / CBS 6284 / DSM 70876 / NBRC 10599 / NRRL Y-10934 / UCD 77-7) TaxID=1071380 RepID=I2H7A1_HENB6|nr:hypothetical protein TBLA_0G03160 [Tetrapisispora blattae CBS 6284]CCH62253.1 hypothetical protein TBLA_0G03160 [Tetrapisispora blattae CBS 6284]
MISPSISDVSTSKRNLDYAEGATNAEAIKTTERMHSSNDRSEIEPAGKKLKLSGEANNNNKNMNGSTSSTSINVENNESQDIGFSAKLNYKNNERDVLAPNEDVGLIEIGKNIETGKYIFPEITKEDSLNARMYLKYYGLTKFLDSYLPEDLNSLYIYFIIKLLGFEITDNEIMTAIYKHVESDSEHLKNTQTKKISLENIDDPLEKKHVVRLIKDLQKAINKILCTRIRLSSFSKIDDFVEKLKNANKILVLTGAGVSTSLGIPDFRSSEGFYSKIRYLGLDDPQDVFNYDIFVQNPSVFYNIAHMVLPPENMYSPLHSFIKMLQDKNKLLRNYTQNIDNLESYAGINPDKLVQCHGSFATASCITCHWQLPGEKIFQNIRNVELPLCPYCYQKRKEFYPTINLDTGENANQSDQINLETSQKRSNSSSSHLSATPQYQPQQALGNIPKSYGVLKPISHFLVNHYHQNSIRQLEKIFPNVIF